MDSVLRSLEAGSWESWILWFIFFQIRKVLLTMSEQSEFPEELDVDDNVTSERMNLSPFVQGSSSWITTTWV